MRAWIAVAFVACGSAGEILVNIGPLFVGATAELYSVRTAMAGSVLTIELGALAAAALTVERVALRFGVRRAAACAALAVVAGDALVFVASSLPVFVIARVVCGAGAGALMAIGNTLIGTTADPHRLYAAVGVAVGAIVLAMLPAVAPAHAVVGPGGVYLVHLATGALLGVCALGLPRTLTVPVQAQRARIRLTPAAAAGVLAFGLYFCADVGFWAYFERIGALRGLSLGAITTVFMVNGVVAILCPMLAAVIGLRRGFWWPYALSWAAQVAGTFLLASGNGLHSFVAGSLAFSGGFMFSVPYLKWAMARADAGARALNYAMSAMAIGCAVGPAFMGWVAEWAGGYTAMAWTFTLLMVVTTLLLRPLVRQPAATCG